MATYYAKIYTKFGGLTPVIVEVSAPDTANAKKLIELKPEFKSFIHGPQMLKMK